MASSRLWHVTHVDLPYNKHSQFRNMSENRGLVAVNGHLRIGGEEGKKIFIERCPVPQGLLRYHILFDFEMFAEDIAGGISVIFNRTYINKTTA